MRRQKRNSNSQWETEISCFCTDKQNERAVALLVRSLFHPKNIFVFSGSCVLLYADIYKFIGMNLPTGGKGGRGDYSATSAAAKSVRFYHDEEERH